MFQLPLFFSICQPAIEAGETCEIVSLVVGDHANGLLGFPVDGRRAVRVKNVPVRHLLFFQDKVRRIMRLQMYDQ